MAKRILAKKDARVTDPLFYFLYGYLERAVNFVSIPMATISRNTRAIEFLEFFCRPGPYHPREIKRFISSMSFDEEGRKLGRKERGLLKLVVEKGPYTSSEIDLIKNMLTYPIVLGGECPFANFEVEYRKSGDDIEHLYRMRCKNGQPFLDHQSFLDYYSW